MIYLLRSAECKDKENGEIEFFLSLKIGYTKDETADVTKNKRLLNYLTHNRTIKLLATIPNATEEQEIKLHHKFRDKLWEGDEWYNYDQEIIDYFKSVTLEDLDNLPFPPNSRIHTGLARNIVSKFLNYSNPTLISNRKEELDTYINRMISDIGKEIMSEDKIWEYLRNDKNIDNKQLDNYFTFLKNFEEGNFSEDPKINKEVILFFNNYEKLTTKKAKLKLLCECGLPSSAIDIILSQIPESDEIKSYYISLGPKRLKELSYNVTYIKKDLNIVTFSEQLLENEIYKNFKVGDKLLLSDIKEKLTNIYSSINYVATPKASDLSNYFIVKPITITIIENGNKKRSNGYELLLVKS